LSVLFIGDRAMRTLNHAWRNLDRTTDVLSFPMREGRFPDVQPDLLGDIVISVPAAQRQADKAGHALVVELERLLVHGLVHLLGHDHEQGLKEARSMERKERQLLKRMSA
jgi:probable rRNA maturation factor